MKKVRLALLIVFIICLLNSTKVLATDTFAKLNTSKSTLKPGDTFTVTLNVSCDSGLSFIGTEIKYDTKVLTLQKKGIANNWIEYGKDKLELFVNSSSKITEVTACTYTFKVNANAKGGTTKISTTPIDIMDIKNNEYTSNKLEKTIEITNEKDTDKKDEVEEDNKNEQIEQDKSETINKNKRTREEEKKILARAEKKYRASLEREQQDEIEESESEQKVENEQKNPEENKNENITENQEEKNNSNKTEKNKSIDNVIFILIVIFGICAILFVILKITEKK